MKFSALNPSMTASSLPGVNDLRFTCPLCHTPYEVVIRVHRGEPDGKRGIWRWTAGGPDWDKFTLEPSVHNHNHGLRKTCGWHGSITNGDVLPA